MNFQNLFKNCINFNYIPVRMCSNSPKGIKYPGFTYYPRTEDFKDPPYEPSKLFLVKRIKSLKGRVPEERKALKLLSLDGSERHNGHINIVKNIPSVNAVLWKVKHLVEIKPITWKGELPKDDFSGTYLRHTGELVLSPRLKISQDELTVTEKYIKNPNRLGRLYLREYLRKKWTEPFTGEV